MFCYTLPSVDNVNPKQLVLYVANSMQWYFPTGLIGGGLDAPMPNEAESCVLAQVSAGLKSGKEYTVRLEQYPSVLVSANLWLAKARVRIAAYSNYQDSLKLRIKWAVTPGAARAKDVIKVIDSQGNVVDWWFTSCSCKDGTTGAVPSNSGSIYVTVVRSANTPKGGFQVKYYPSGGEMVAAVAKEWIPWWFIGW